ncbi:MAG: PilZ domain-containing protein [SAR324 cluster bacterium]|nr:PilZ domain-containing protein [SAR324 cluster bacterium]
MEGERHSHRVQQKLPCLIVNRQNLRYCEGKIIDLSSTGMLLSGMDSQFAVVGHPLQVTFLFLSLDDEEEELFINANVVRVIPQNDDEAQLGVQFKDNTERMRKMLEVWLTLKFEQDWRKEIHYMFK